MRRFLIVGGVLCGIGYITYRIASFDPDAPRSDWPVLQAAAPSLTSHAAVVSPNVCVSGGQPGRFLYCTIAADPNDSSRLFAACLQKTSKNQNAVGFFSDDGGVAWGLGCERVGGATDLRSDISVGFGPDGRLYLVCMRVNPNVNGPLGSDGLDAIEFLASIDGGQTWSERAVISKSIDRPWIIADTGASGRLYCVGNIDELIFLRSNDESGTFAPPLTPVGHKLLNCRPANPVVTSTGTLMLVCEDRIIKTRRMGTRYRPRLLAFRSSDGGESFTECTPVNTRWWHPVVESSRSGATWFPQLAADPGSTRFGGHIYCVWGDGKTPQTESIFFSSSPDEGNTWTDAIVLSEQPLSDEADGEYMSYIPSIAVNQEGVIAVTWYDRRGLPPARLVPFEGQGKEVLRLEAPGWNVRFRASRDGGATWLSSVQLNEKPGQGAADVGHAAGLAASRDSQFHAAWIDNRTGRTDLWTAAVAIRGNH
jgi:hypothetical protein